MKAKFRYQDSYLSYVILFFFFYVCMGVFTSILSVYLIGIGKSNTEMSFIMSGANLFGIVMIPAVGYTVDRVRKPKLIVSVLLAMMAAMGFIFAACRSTFVLYLLNGLIMGVINAAFPVTERAAGSGRFRYGTIRIWGTIGYAASAQLSGVLLAHTDPTFIFMMFFASAILAIIGLGGTAAISGRQESQGKTSVGRQFSFLRSPSFLLFVIISFIFTGGSTLMLSYGPVFLQELGMSSDAVGTVLAVSTLIELPIILFSNKFMDRFSGKTLLMVNFGIMFVQYLCYGAIYSAIAAVIVMLLLKATGSTLFMMIRLKIVKNLVGEEAVSTAQGVESAVSAVGAVILLNAGGLIAETADIHTLFFIFSGLMALGFALCIFLRINNTKKVFS